MPPTPSPLCFQNPFQRVTSALPFRTLAFRNVVKALLLQHPIDLLLFPFLDLDRVEHVSLLIVLVFLPLFRVQLRNVCCWSAEYRLTLSSRLSSTNCFPNPATAPFLPINRTRRFSPEATRCPFRFFTHEYPCCSPPVVLCSYAPATHRTSHQVYPSIVEQFLHMGMHQLNACTTCSCKKCLSMLNCLLYALMQACAYCLCSSCILHLLNLLFRLARL